MFFACLVLLLPRGSVLITSRAVERLVGSISASGYEALRQLRGAVKRACAKFDMSVAAWLGAEEGKSRKVGDPRF